MLARSPIGLRSSLATRTFSLVPAATLGESFNSFFDAVDQFFSNLASVRLGPCSWPCILFTTYLSFRARASFNILRAAYPSEPFRFRVIWGAYFAGYGFNSVIPARGGDVVRLFLTKSSIPNSSYPAVGASFFVEAGFDIAMGSLILLFAFSQGVFPKPPDFAKLNAFDLSYLAAHPRFTLFFLTVLAVGALVAFAMLSARAKAFWDRVKQGLTILRDRRRYLREVFLVQLIGWFFRFAAFWMLLEAFRVGGSVRNVLLVLGVNAVAAAVPFTPQGAGRGPGAAGEGVRGHGECLHRGRLLGGPADRHRGAHVRPRVPGAGVHLPGAQLQGGHPPGARGARRGGAGEDAGARRGLGRLVPKPSRASRTRITASGNTTRMAWRRSCACCSALPWRFRRAMPATVMSTASLIALSAHATF